MSLGFSIRNTRLVWIIKVLTLVFIALIFTDCTPKILSRTRNSKLHSCLSKPESFDLNLLLDSFDKHIDDQYQGFSDFLVTYAILSPSIRDFTTNEMVLAEYLETSNFRSKFYQITYVSDSKDTLSKAQYEDDPSSANVHMRLDINKSFIECLSSLSTSNQFVSNYLVFETEAISAPTPIETAMFLIDQKEILGYSESLARTIASLECYLVIAEILHLYPTLLRRK